MNRESFQRSVDGLIVIAKTTKEAGEFAPFPFIKAAAGTVIALLEIIRSMRANKDSCLLLAKDATQLLDAIAGALKDGPKEALPDMKAAIDGYVGTLENILTSVQELAARNRVQRFFQHASDADAINECRQKLNQSFTVFMTVTQMQIRYEQQRTREEMLRIHEEERLVLEEQRKQLKISLESRYTANLQVAQARWDESKKCLEGTRTKLLHDIGSWAQATDPSAKSLYWLADVAGSGKSTIAHHMASEWRRSSQLGGCFFFSRAVADRKDLNLFCSTICSHLAEWHSDLKPIICEAIGKFPSISSMSFREQFESLIEGPLRQARKTLIFVIDALDECDITSRSPLLKVLAEITRLSLPLKIFVTSRPERDIFESIGTPEQFRAEFDLYGTSNKSDVRQFVKTQLLSVHSLRPSAAWPGPTSDEISAISERAGGLFIWASTACRMIKDSANPRKQLSRLISDPSLDSLDKLYLEALRQAAPADDPISREEVSSILHIIATAMEPLSIDAIDELLGIENTENVIQRLGSVLSFSGVRTMPIRVLHPTFLEFLVSTDRCCDTSFHIDIPETHNRLAEACFTSLRALREDICHIKDPSLLNAEIPGLEEKVSQAFTETLIYACRFWAYHVANSNADEVQGLTMLFFKNDFLHWLEALSLLQRIGEGISALLHLDTRIKHDQLQVNETQLWCHDALKFIQAHHIVIQLSALHVYLSALAFSPPSSLIWKRYSPSRTKLPDILRGLDQSWFECLTLEGHAKLVSSIVFSLDGSRLYSGSYDHTVRVWDAISGTAIGIPFGKQDSEIGCIALSPDGTRIASGARDGVVGVWDAVSGSALDGVLNNHFHSVKGVAFSLDNTRVLSISEDSFRVWDISSASTISTIVLEGSPSCVAFSPDRTRFAGIYDRRHVRISDCTSGSAAINISEEIPNTVECLAFSPDGTRIVTGTNFGTIRRWDALKGLAVGAAFTGHCDDVTCIAFSPDGARFASSSKERAVRMWDAHSESTLDDRAKTELGPCFVNVGMWDVISDAALGGVLTADTVQCIAFSPDGTRIASGSRCGSIEIWEMSSMKQPPKKNRKVDSIVLSPDGTRIATSYMVPPMVHIWDTETGTLLGQYSSNLPRVVELLLFSDDGSEIIAHDSFDRTCRWKCPELPSTTNRVSTSRLVHLPPSGPNPENEEAEVELASDGWVYQVGKRPRRLLYLPTINRGVSTARGPFLITGSGRTEMTIIDFSRLLGKFEFSFSFPMPWKAGPGHSDEPSAAIPTKAPSNPTDNAMKVFPFE